MDLVKSVFCHDSNQILLYSLLDEQLNEQLNIKIKNIPNIMTLLREHMYGTYKVYVKDKIFELKTKKDINDFVKEINTLTLKSFLKDYLKNEYIPNIQYYHSVNKKKSSNCEYLNKFESNTNYTGFQNKFNEVQNKKLLSRCFGNNNILSERLQVINEIYQQQEYNPKELMMNLNENYNTNKYKPNEKYQNFLKKI